MKLIFIFLILIFSINFNSSQFISLSPEVTLTASVINNTTFSYIPDYSDHTYCLFPPYQILIDVENGFSITTAVINNTNYNIEKKFQNFNSYLFNINTQYLLSFGSVSLLITFTTNDTIEHSYQLIGTCNELQVNNLKIDSLNSFYYSGSFFQYISISGIYPLPNQIRLIGNDGSLGFTNDDEYNYILQIFQFNQNNITDDIDLVFGFSGNRNYSIKIKSYYNQFNEIDLPTNHIETFFPPEISSTSYSYKQFGYLCNPVIQSNINTNIMRPYQYLFTIYSPKYTLPIKGKKGNMTFIGLFMESTNLVTGNGLNNIDIITLNPNITSLHIPSMGASSSQYTFSDGFQIQLFTLNFNNSNTYQGTDLFFLYFTFIYQSWPFGFLSGTNTNYEFKSSFVRLNEYKPISNEYLYFGSDKSKLELYHQITPNKTQTSSPPQLLSYKYSRVSNYMYILRLNIQCDGGVRNIQTYSVQTYFGLDTLVSGTIYNGIFEIVASPDELSFVSITDQLGNSKQFSDGDVISLNPFTVFRIPSEIKFKINISNLNNITFLKNDIDLSEDCHNIVYIDFNDNVPTDKTLSFVLMDIISIPSERELIDIMSTIDKRPFKFNNITKKFESKFIVPKNNMFGNIQYLIFFGNLNGIYGNQLTTSLIVNNTILDNQGPLFSSFEKIRNGSIISTAGTIGWRFDITDDLNGFESGYIKVMGSVDSSTYHFNFTIDDAISGDKFNCQFQILINVSQPCITQEYRIVKVILYDSNKIASRFNLYTPIIPTASIISPFLNLLDQGLDITILPFTCSPSVLLDAKPVLLSFTPSKALFDVGASNRTISFDFSIEPSYSVGLKQDQLPIVYISSLFSGLIECSSTVLLGYSASEARYKCSTELPLGFGYPHPLIFSLYGIVNNGGYFYGYSSSDLALISNYYANTTISFNQPVIKSADKYYSDDNGELVIYGRAFSNVNLVSIDYSDNQLSPHSFQPSIIYESSAIRISGIRSTSKPFYITLSTNDSLTSNIFTVDPIYFNANTTPIPTESPTTSPTASPTDSPTTSPTSSPTTSPTTSPTSPTPSPTMTLIPTATPIPTNAPQKCQGNPECGGKNQGYCSSTTGCICYPPWIGTTCSSRIIIVPQPSINKTNPQVEIPTTPTESNGQSSAETNSEESQKMIFKSLISLVSLRELDFNNKEVNSYIFDQWIYTPINQFKNQYFTTISNTNITATLEWFNQSTFIQFANQNLTMNPSSIKYTIEISKYQFSSSLNQLQLVMAASLTSNSNDICSLNQFGNTSTGDDSNYLKIQIENHSLYGRFIKRAIIDNTVKSISNVLLDSSLNIIDSSTSSLQSYIGITIPFYSDSIIVDPDFSVLIDSKSASDQDNSICTNKKSGLTTAQLAGIIIGSIAFAIVIVISIIYVMVKRKGQKKFITSMNNKLNKINQ
ncbi:hypothetical protein ACTA71_000608 [Dictyostelium dimigraforme]